MGPHLFESLNDCLMILGRKNRIKETLHFIRLITSALRIRGGSWHAMGNKTGRTADSTPTINHLHPMTIILSALIFAGLITSVVNDTHQIKVSQRLNAAR